VEMDSIGGVLLVPISQQEEAVEVFFGKYGLAGE